MHKTIVTPSSIKSRISDGIFRALKAVVEEMIFIYEYFILKTPADCYWKLKRDTEIYAFKLKNDGERLLAKFEGDILEISGDCKAKFYVDPEVKMHVIRKFTVSWLKRETNVSAKFDSRFELISYDACYDEKVVARHCSGTWHVRGNDRWLENQGGKVLCQYNVEDCVYKYRNNDWKDIDTIEIEWNSEEDFRHFIENHIYFGARDVI